MNSDLINVPNLILIGLMAYIFIFGADRVLAMVGKDQFRISS